MGDHQEERQLGEGREALDKLAKIIEQRDRACGASSDLMLSLNMKLPSDGYPGGMGLMRRREPSRNADKIVVVVVLVTIPLATFVVRKFGLPDRLLEALAIATIVTLLVAGYVQYPRRSRAAETNVKETDAG